MYISAVVRLGGFVPALISKKYFSSSQLTGRKLIKLISMSLCYVKVGIEGGLW